MGTSTIDHLIINSPYEEPRRYWHYDPVLKWFELKEGRRPAGYVVATRDSESFDDPGEFVPIPLVNQVRPRVKAWRQAGYPGVTGITRRLLEHWTDPERAQRFFFCQLEAIETLIWLTEAPEADRVGIEIPGDGGPFIRQCCKMATGTGKTIVMAMAIAWHILNKVSNPWDNRFSKYVLVIAPGLTVKKRLGVLYPTAEGNYYEAFDIVPSALMEKLRQGRVLVRNWHALAWETEEQLKKRKSVDKRGPLSDEAYARKVLGEMVNARNLLVINDEAHHAWRINPQAASEYSRQRALKDSAEEATIWIGGLDRLHQARGILKCYDFSATPFAPSGGKSSGETLFGWIVSDFGLNDAIESGLVKTPRVVIRDNALPNAKTYRSRLYHIYNDPEAKTSLNRKAEPHAPLPDLVLKAYHLLGADWLETFKAWQAANIPTPPVMITVCNRTETAARVYHAFIHRKVHIDELCKPEHILHIDSKVLAMAEAQEEASAGVDSPEESDTKDETSAPTARKLTQAQQAEALRQKVDTVGKVGQPGEQIRNVISVGMLSEGWDAKTVTHIMGLRAFTSQLLCEQVVGRGLRRTSYEINPETGLLEPEYVNIFGVPFTFLPHESTDSGPPKPTVPKTLVQVDPAKARFEIRWPHVVRTERVLLPRLTVDWSKVLPLEIDAADTPRIAELAPIVEGKPDVTQIRQIDLDKLAREFRMQRIIFEAARDVFDQIKPTWQGSREVLLAQLIQIVETFIRSDRIKIRPQVFERDEMRRRLLITLNLSRIVQHVVEAIRHENTVRLEPVFDRDRPIRSTADMRPWYTSKPCHLTQKSHINVCVYDSTWEASDAFVLDQSDAVVAWAKNDHLGFEIFYVYDGVVKKYRPDFLIRLSSGDYLVLETKGQDTEEDRVKREYLKEWCEGVNEHGGFGRWHWAVVKQPGEIWDVLANGHQ